MRFISVTGTVSFSFIVGLAGFAGAAHPQSWTPPSEAERCPTKWGAGDERGAANHMGPETVLRAARLIRTGEVIELAHVVVGIGASGRPALRALHEAHQDEPAAQSPRLE